MTTTKSYYVYAHHKRFKGAMHQLWFDTFEEAHKVAKTWAGQGSVLVHITEKSDDAIEELLIWAAASPELDWREQDDKHD